MSVNSSRRHHQADGPAVCSLKSYHDYSGSAMKSIDPGKQKAARTGC